MAVPRRVVQVVELDEGVTLVSLICEDLARLDEVADLLRAIGPTLVVTTLLDGPQLALNLLHHLRIASERIGWPRELARAGSKA
jgi:hypothetical protein